MLTVAMTAFMLAGCSDGGDAKADSPKDTEKPVVAESGEEVTLKLFSNLPDRKTGQGLVEQMIIDEYMEENQNVKIEVEALDEEAYKTKFKPLVAKRGIFKA